MEEQRHAESQRQEQSDATPQIKHKTPPIVWLIILILAAFATFGSSNGWEDYCDTVASGSIEEVESGDCP